MVKLMGFPCFAGSLLGPCSSLLQVPEGGNDGKKADYNGFCWVLVMFLLLFFIFYQTVHSESCKAPCIQARIQSPAGTLALRCSNSEEVSKPASVNCLRSISAFTTPSAVHCCPWVVATVLTPVGELAPSCCGARCAEGVAAELTPTWTHTYTQFCWSEIANSTVLLECNFEPVASQLT